jgi:hypothetical protein
VRDPIVSRQIDRERNLYTDGRRSAIVAIRGTGSGRYFVLETAGREYTIRRRRQAVKAAIRYVRTGEVWTDYRKGED